MNPSEKSLEDLEKIYSKKPVTAKPDQDFGGLKVSKEEMNDSSRIPISQVSNERTIINSAFRNADSTVETRNLLGGNASSAINYKYSSEIKDMKVIVRRWTLIMLSILSIEFLYLGINLWVFAGKANNIDSTAISPPFQKIYLMMVQMNDVLFFSIGVNTIFSFAGVLVCLSSIFLIGMEKYIMMASNSERIFIICEMAFKVFHLAMIVGIGLKLIGIAFDPQSGAVLIQILKLLVFGFGLYAWRKTIHYKQIHHEMVQEILERAKDDEQMLNDIYENWNNMYD